MNRRTILLGLLACAACAPSGPGADSEVAAELRALRAAMLARNASAPAVDAGKFAEGLAPLREVLGGLAASQRDLQQQQVALTQEMQRWSQLLVDSTSGTRRDEAQALTARLQQLEGALAEQQARYREVETLMQGVLERTAERLEQLLRGLEASGPQPTAPAAPAAPEARPTTGSVGAAGGVLLPDAVWWSGALALATAVTALAWLRWRQTNRRRPGAAFGAASGHAAPAPDQDVQEIWAAAALLGEAVGRLRESNTAGTDVAEALDLDSSERSSADEIIVLDDELLHPDATPTIAAPNTAAPTAAAAPRHVVSDAMERMPRLPSPETCVLRTADPGLAMQAVLQVLEEDPRVLRRPEPTVRCRHDSLEVTFRVVPDLPPGERSHLRQRLQDACG